MQPGDSVTKKECEIYEEATALVEELYRKVQIHDTELCNRCEALLLKLDAPDPELDDPDDD